MLSSLRPLARLAAGLAAVALIAGAVAVAQPAAAAMLTGPLQNSKKTTYLGLSGASWVDINTARANVTYPDVGETGIVSIGATCVSKATVASANELTTTALGTGSNCLSFTAEVTQEGFFTFRVSAPGLATDGRYLGDGNAGGVLDLLSTTPIVLFSIPEQPGVTLADTAATTDLNSDGRIGAGDTVTYTATIGNTGNVRLSALALTDTLATAITCSPTVVDSRQSISCASAKPHVLTQAEVDAGTLSNTVRLAGKTPRALAVSAGPDTVDIALVSSAAISAALTSDVGANPAVGAKVTYTATLTNDGNVTLTKPGITATGGGSARCAAGPIAPGSSITCTFERTLTQADVDAGSFVATAAPTATAPDGTAVAGEKVSFTNAIAPQTSLTAKAGAGAGVSSAGDSAAFTVTVTNAGNVTMSAISVAPSSGTPAECADASLAPGASTTCVVELRATQADVDAGSLDFTAEVLGAAPGQPSSIFTDVESTLTIAAKPSISAKVVSDAADQPHAGDVVAYRVTAKNTGNVTLSGVALTGAEFGQVCPAGALAPGASVDCTASRIVSQADVNAGFLAYADTIVAAAPKAPASELAKVSIRDQVAALASTSLTVTGAAPAAPRAGQNASVHAVLTNTGNVTLSKLSLTVRGGSLECLVATVESGASVECDGAIALTQAMIDAGTTDAVVRGDAAAPGGESVAISSVTVAVPLETVPKATATLEWTSTAQAGELAVGDEIVYSARLVNSGNVTLTEVDPVWSSAKGVKFEALENCATSLAPGTETVCRDKHVVTQDDVDAGEIRVGIAPTATHNGDTVPLGPVTASITLAPFASLEAAVAADRGVSAAGDTVTFTVTVKNSGNVTMSGLSLSPSIGKAAACAVTRLAPGASTTCAIEVTATQAMLDAGVLRFAGDVSGAEPSEKARVFTSVESTLAIAATPRVSAKVVSNAAEQPVVGEAVAYRVTVKNTGNVTLSAVGLAGSEFGQKCPAGELTPGDSIECTASRIVSQADVDAGFLAYEDTVVGAAPRGVAGELATISLRDGVAALVSTSLTVTGVAPAAPRAKQDVAVHAVLRNTGNVSLAGLALEVRDGALRCLATTVEPGASVECDGTISLTQAMVDAGTVVASVSGTATVPAGGAMPIAPAEVTIPLEIVPGATVSLDWTAGKAADALAVGDEIVYTARIANSGNVTLTGVNPVWSMADTRKKDAATCATTLAPAAEATCEFKQVVSQADVDAGQILFGIAPVATYNGKKVPLTPVTGAITFAAAPALAAAVRAGSADPQVADSVEFTVTVTNSGNVTVSSVAVAPAVGVTAGCADTTLAPGASTTCVVTMTVTQADVDGGSLVFAADVAGAAPSAAARVFTTAGASVAIAARPSLSATVVSDAAGQPAVGDVVAYRVTVKNTGTVTMSGVALGGTEFAQSCPAGALAPGASLECTASRTVSQADVDAGRLEYADSVLGAAPGAPAAEYAKVSTVDRIAALASTSLTVSGAAPAAPQAGQDASVHAVVTNTGNVTLGALSLAVDGGSIVCAAAGLSPGASVECDGAIPLSQAMIDAGTADAVVSGSATTPAGSSLEIPELSVAVPLETVPDVRVTLDWTSEKDASELLVGDVITYTARIVNIGNVTVTGVEAVWVVGDGVEFEVLGDCGTTLAPGEETTCQAKHEVTQADIDAGEVQLTVAPRGDYAGERLPLLPAASAIALTQRATGVTAVVADASAPLQQGARVRFTSTVTNTGTVTLTKLEAVETVSGTTQSCDVTTLAPGKSATCESTLVVGPAHLDARKVIATVTASALAPNGDRAEIAPTTLDLPTVEPSVLAFTGSTGGATLIGMILAAAFGLVGVILVAFKRRRMAEQGRS